MKNKLQELPLEFDEFPYKDFTIEIPINKF